MSYVEDTQIKDGHYAPGTILDDGKWRVEFDSMLVAFTALRARA
jgi:fumarate hydratase, class II